jgi:heme-degrading monooxygenase HmoA
MLARLTTIRGSMIRIDEAIRRYREEIAPRLRAMEGCEGASLLVDRAKGQVLAISLWATEAAERASEHAVAQSRDDVAAEIGATEPPTVAIYEVAVPNPSTEPALLARVVTLQAPPDRLEEGIRRFQEEEVPQVRALTGCKGASLLVNRASGEFVVMTFWATAAAQQASNAALAPRRAQFASDLGATQPPAVAVYDIAVQNQARQPAPSPAHLPQPPAPPAPHA